MPAPMDTKQIIDAINELVGTDKAKAIEFAKELRSGARDVAGSLINVGKSQAKKDGGAEVDTLKKQVTDLTEAIEAKDAELTEARAKAPEAKAVEDRLKAAHDKALMKERERAEKAEANATNLVTQVALDKAIARLITPNEQGQRTDPEYAELIAAAKLRGLMTPKPDGSIGVRMLDGAGEYDGESLDQKIDALVKDFRPTIPASFTLTNADSGAGVRNGGGSAVGLKTQQQIREQKLSNPAFAGL